MSAPDDHFDFATLLRGEAAADKRTHSAADNGLAAVVSEPSLQPDGEGVSSEAGGGTGDHDRSAQQEADARAFDASRYLQGGGLKGEQAAVPHPADTPPPAPAAPNPVLRPADAGPRHRIDAALTKTLAVAHERLSTTLSRSFRLPGALVSPLRGIFSGAVVFGLIAGMIVVVLAHYVGPRTSDSETDFSGGSKLASTNPQPVEAPPAAAQESTPVGSLNAITPASFRDVVDPDIKIQASSEVKTPESVPAVAPTNVKSPASSENTPPSELPKLAAMYSQPVAEQLPPLTPIPPVRPPPRQSRSANETTASISETKPSSETKTTALQAEATQPSIDDASRRKHDQKPGKAVETSSCTADVFPGYVRASARIKPGQVDVQKICADPRAPFTVSVRCLVAAVVCSDYPADKEAKVAQKAIAPNRVPSHTLPDTKSH